MIFSAEGILTLSNDNTYGLYTGLTYERLEELLNNNLMDKCEVRVIKQGKEIFNKTGKLIKRKFKDKGGYQQSKQCNLWLYHVGVENLDDVLFNNVGRRVQFYFKNIDDEKEFNRNIDLEMESDVVDNL